MPALCFLQCQTTTHTPHQRPKDLLGQNKANARLHWIKSRRLHFRTRARWRLPWTEGALLAETSTAFHHESGFTLTTNARLKLCFGPKSSFDQAAEFLVPCYGRLSAPDRESYFNNARHADSFEQESCCRLHIQSFRSSYWSLQLENLACTTGASARNEGRP